MQKSIRMLLTAIDRLADVLGIIAAICLAVLIGSMITEVIARYVFKSPTVWAFDVSTMSYGLLYIAAAGVALRKKQHIMIDFLFDRLPPFAQHLIHMLLYVFLILPALLFLSWAGIRETWLAHVNKETTKLTPLALTLWPLFAAFAIGIITLTLQVVAQILRHILALTKIRSEKRIAGPVAAEP